MLEGNISVISVINTSSIVITVLASRFILKEKITWKKYLMITRNIYMCSNLIVDKINPYINSNVFYKILTPPFYSLLKLKIVNKILRKVHL